MDIARAQERAEADIVAATYDLLASQATLVIAMLRKQTDRPLSDPRVQRLLNAIVAEWKDTDGIFHQAWIETLGALYLGLVATSVRTLRAQLPDFELPPATVNSVTSTLASARAETQAVFITESIAGDFANMVNRVAGMDATMTVGDATLALQTSGGGLIGVLSPERMTTRAQGIGATEAPSWLNQTRAALVQEQGFYAENTWRTELDDTVRLTHALQEGMRLPIGTQYPNGCTFPGDPEADISETINCFPGDTLVTARGLQGGYRRLYSGEVVRVVIDGCVDNLTATPNHPIATTRGWVPSSHLRPGDEVLSGSFADFASARDVDVVDVPTRIEQVVDALAESWYTMRTRGRRVDFHGDGAKSDVDIVGSDSFLRRAYYAVESSDKSSELPLANADVRDAFLTTSSVTFQKLRRFFSAARGIVRGTILRLALLWTHARPLESLRVGSTQRDNAAAVEREGDAQSATPEALRYAKNGRALVVQCADAGIKIVPRRVLSVTVKPFDGHVYNLQCESSLYIASGIVSHNCRCWLDYS